MEYAAGGELFDRIVRAGRFSEDEARFFFQQLVSGVAYCHAEGVCHRDLKLENTLLDGGAAPRLKICDFGYSKSALFDSQPKSTVGTPAYIAPEVLSRKQYDGEVADVWSTGVTLYVMLVGAYPFEDPADPRNFRKTIQVREWWGGGVGREREKNITVFSTHPPPPPLPTQRIMGVKYSFPPSLHLSRDCVDLIARIFVGNPAHRITIAGIRAHPWFQKNLPAELSDGGVAAAAAMPHPTQSVDEVKRIVADARSRPGAPAGGHGVGDEFDEERYMDNDLLADEEGLLD